jgi:hypothetical protein
MSTIVPSENVFYDDLMKDRPSWRIQKHTFPRGRYDVKANVCYIAHHKDGRRGVVSWTGKMPPMLPLMASGYTPWS